jgi:hypothetical protein
LAGAWGSWLARLSFGASLVAVVVVLGPVACRLGRESGSGRQAARERVAPARHAAEPRQIDDVGAETRLADRDGAVPTPLLGSEEKRQALDPGRVDGADAPLRLLDAAQGDLVFEQRLRASEEDLRGGLRALAEVRLVSDGDVQTIRKDERAVQEQLQAQAQADLAAAGDRLKAAHARMAQISSAMSGNPHDPLLRNDQREADRIAQQAGRAYGVAADAYRRAASRASRDQERIGYENDLRLHQTLQRTAVRAGLALLSRPNCQLSPPTAAQVAALSKELRDKGFVSIPGVPSGSGATLRLVNARGVVITGRRVTIRGRPIPSPDSPEVPAPGSDNADEAAGGKTNEFQAWCDQHRLEGMSATVPTLTQMLQIEDEAKRLLLVRELTRILGEDATAQLAVRAIVDLSPAVRRAALAGLGQRPWGQYGPVLLRGLRYPWPPVADHAAVALRTLQPREAVIPLVDLLDLPSPSAPVLDARTNQYAVREVVRVNHLRNCLLCHAPSAGKDDGLVRGLVPTPGEPLPVQYYESPGGHFVRADITFLRQDFSVNLPEESAGPWPREQRYDFVTRLRTLSPGELTDLPASGPYPQRDAVLYALRGLTGKDGGDASARWRELVGSIAERPKGEQKSPALEMAPVSLIDPNRPR